MDQERGERAGQVAEDADAEHHDHDSDHPSLAGDRVEFGADRSDRPRRPPEGISVAADRRAGSAAFDQELRRGAAEHDHDDPRRQVEEPPSGQRQAKLAQPLLGYGYLHTAIDDHSRLAYTEILPDERKHTAAAFWQRAQAFFAGCGITVRRVLTDNGSAYRSRLWHDTLTAAGIAHKRTRPFRPQTNGKVERYHRTLLDEWAYARPYTSEAERRAALAPWLHIYNHHRGHTALGGLPPASRVTNLPTEHT